MKDRILHLSEKYYPEMLLMRRTLHQNPELSFNEFRTSEYIRTRLEEFGIPFRAGYVNTGILGIINPSVREGKTIALRADMDALPVHEQNDLPHKSINSGIMHACGHDIHMACLLGAARILKDLAPELKGRVLLVFQPGEEKLPGGASKMLEQGVFNTYKPDWIIGQHVYPDLPAGHAGFREGIYMASSDEITITVKGKGGHAAMPHLTPDTILTAAQIIVALQQVASRFAPAQIPTVLTFGNIITYSGAMNVIPQSVTIEGTFRTMDEKWRAAAHQKIRQLALSVAEGMGAECDVAIGKGYPVLVNHPATTQLARECAREFLGSQSITDLDIRMTSEDFSYFSQRYPAVFYRLGTGWEGREISQLHSSGFDANEEALKYGSGLLAYMAVKFLNGGL